MFNDLRNSYDSLAAVVAAGMQFPGDRRIAVFEWQRFDEGKDEYALIGLYSDGAEIPGSDSGDEYYQVVLLEFRPDGPGPQAGDLLAAGTYQRDGSTLADFLIVDGAGRWQSVFGAFDVAAVCADCRCSMLMVQPSPGADPETAALLREGAADAHHTDCAAVEQLEVA